MGWGRLLCRRLRHPDASVQRLVRSALAICAVVVTSMALITVHHNQHHQRRAAATAVQASDAGEKAPQHPTATGRTKILQEAEGWEETIRGRLATLRRGCQVRGATRDNPPPPPLPRGYVVHPESGLAYCHIPKVASTFWLEKLARLTHPEMGEEEMSRILKQKGDLLLVPICSKLYNI